MTYIKTGFVYKSAPAPFEANREKVGLAMVCYEDRVPPDDAWRMAQAFLEACAFRLAAKKPTTVAGNPGRKGGGEGGKEKRKRVPKTKTKRGEREGERQRE